MGKQRALAEKMNAAERHAEAHEVSVSTHERSVAVLEAQVEGANARLKASERANHQLAEQLAAAREESLALSEQASLY